VFPQSAATPEQRGQAPDERRRHLSRWCFRDPPGWLCAHGNLRRGASGL